MSVLLSENDTDTLVHALAKQRGQETFTLVQQDRSGAATIIEWIKLNLETAPDEKLRDAFERALKFKNFPHRKNAD